MHAVDALQVGHQLVWERLRLSCTSLSLVVLAITEHDGVSTLVLGLLVLLDLSLRLDNERVHGLVGLLGRAVVTVERRAIFWGIDSGDSDGLSPFHIFTFRQRNQCKREKWDRILAQVTFFNEVPCPPALCFTISWRTGGL